MKLEITSNHESVGRGVALVFSDQLPFVEAMAINDSAKQAQKVQRAHQREAFEVRRKSFMDRAVKIKPFATKQKAEAKISVDPPGGQGTRQHPDAARGGRSQDAVYREDDCRAHRACAAHLDWPHQGEGAAERAGAPRTVRTPAETRSQAWYVSPARPRRAERDDLRETAGRKIPHALSARPLRRSRSTAEVRREHHTLSDRDLPDELRAALRHGDREAEVMQFLFLPFRAGSGPPRARASELRGSSRSTSLAGSRMIPGVR